MMKLIGSGVPGNLTEDGSCLALQTNTLTHGEKGELGKNRKN